MRPWLLLLQKLIFNKVQWYSISYLLVSTSKLTKLQEY